MVTVVVTVVVVVVYGGLGPGGPLPSDFPWQSQLGLPALIGIPSWGGIRIVQAWDDTWTLRHALTASSR